MVLPFQGGWSVGAGGDSLIMAEQQPTGNRSTLESRLLTPPCSPPAWLLGTIRDSPIRRPSRIRSAVENESPMCRTIRAMLAALCFASSPGLQPILPCLAQYRRDMLDWHKWELHASTRGAVTPFFCRRAPLGVRLFLSKRGNQRPSAATCGSQKPVSTSKTSVSTNPAGKQDSRPPSRPQRSQNESRRPQPTTDH
jgi:hypothetical protein